MAIEKSAWGSKERKLANKVDRQRGRIQSTEFMKKFHSAYRDFAKEIKMEKPRQEDIAQFVEDIRKTRKLSRMADLSIPPRTGGLWRVAADIAGITPPTGAALSQSAQQRDASAGRRFVKGLGYRTTSWAAKKGK